VRAQVGHDRVPAAPAELTQAIDVPLDAHLHTNLSPDSTVPVDIYAAQAVERGIAEIAITDHVDFSPGLQAYRYSSFEDRERTVREAAERWADRGVAIRFGCELTYASRYEAEVRDHLRRYRYDYTIGSVHDEPDSVYSPGRVAAWCAGRPLPEIVKPYFDEVLAAARSGLFDTLGHLDMVKRYLHPHVTRAQLAAAPELYEPVLLALVESGTSLEVNTSGLRQPPAETYPSAAVVARFRALGGSAVTTGSDAHRPEALAFGLEAGYRVVAEAGFRAVTFRRGADRLHVPLPERLRT
jgi:histidinol-phosphatase (PHP family)